MSICDTRQQHVLDHEMREKESRVLSEVVVFGVKKEEIEREREVLSEVVVPRVGRCLVCVSPDICCTPLPCPIHSRHHIAQRTEDGHSTSCTASPAVNHTLLVEFMVKYILHYVHYYTVTDLQYSEQFGRRKIHSNG